MNNIEYGKILATYFYENLLNKIDPKIWLKRQSKIGIIKKISPSIPNGIYDISNIIDFGEYNKVVEKFKQVLDTKLSHCNNRAFYEKIETLELIEQEQNISQDENAEGLYQTRKNKIFLFLANIKKTQNLSEPEAKEEILTHELLHMATSYKKGNIFFCGFSQKIGSHFCKAHALNEGYTELINMRYFHHKKPSRTYKNERLIAYGIEQIVGKKEMESLYFNADLNGLVKQLEKYTTTKEAIRIIDELDKAQKIINKSPEEYTTIISNLTATLANINMEKQRKLLMSGQITTDDYDYQNLKSAFYVKGFILEKQEDFYIVSKFGERYGRLLPKEGYRIIQKKFNREKESSKGFTEEYATPTKNDIVDSTIILNHIAYIENKDLREIENVEVIDIQSREYKITKRISNKKIGTREISKELSEMFISQETSLIEQKRKIG